MSKSINSFEDIIAWQKGYALTLAVYKCSRRFPEDEKFALTSQLRRAATSIPSNIAEGFGRSTTKDYLRFLDMARGSLNEVRTQLRLAADLGYSVEPHLHTDAIEVSRILAGLIASLRNRLS